MTTNPPEKTPTPVTGGSQGLELKEKGLAQGLMRPLSSDQNHDFRQPLIAGLAICFLDTPCTFLLELAGP